MSQLNFFQKIIFKNVIIPSGSQADLHFFFWLSFTLAHPPFLENLRGLHVRVLSLVPNSILFIHGEVQGDHSVHWPMENIKKSFIQ